MSKGRTGRPRIGQDKAPSTRAQVVKELLDDTWGVLDGVNHELLKPFSPRERAAILGEVNGELGRRQREASRPHLLERLKQQPVSTWADILIQLDERYLTPAQRAQWKQWCEQRRLPN